MARCICLLRDQFCDMRELISGDPLFQAFSSLFSASYVSSAKSDIQIKIKRIKARVGPGHFALLTDSLIILSVKLFKHPVYC